MVFQYAVHEFEQYLSDLRAQEDRLLQETQEIQSHISCVEAALEGFMGWKSGNPPRDALSRHSHVQPEDLAHCPTQRAALEQIAWMSDGLVNATDAARVIVEVGKWSGNLGSVGATVYKIMSESNDWKWVEPGVFRLLAYKEHGGNDDELPNPGCSADSALSDEDNVQGADVQKDVLG